MFRTTTITFPGLHDPLVLTHDSAGNELFDGMVYSFLQLTDGTYRIEAVGMSPELAKAVANA